MGKPMHVSRRPFRIALLRTCRVQADGLQECVLKMLFQKRREMRELVIGRLCRSSERVDALEVDIAVLGEVAERGIDERVILWSRARDSRARTPPRSLAVMHGLSEAE